MQAAGGAGGISVLQWTGVLLMALGSMAVVWRYRSWLVGVFENVEVMGKSGADLETELLHHEPAVEGEGPAAQPPPES